MRQEPPHELCGGFSCLTAFFFQVSKAVSPEYFTLMNELSVKYGTCFKRDTR